MVASAEQLVAEPTREMTVDTVRGIAIVMLVLFHVVGYGTTGLRLPDDHPVREFNGMLIYVRMPLFTILSGYVYALRPFAGDVRRFVGGKARRLLIPLLVVGTLFALMQSFTPGANGGLEGDEWLTIHIEPVAHFWFVEALFWVFLVVMVLERLGWLDTVRGTAAVFVAAGLLSAVVQPPSTLGIEGAFYLLPFFVFGLAVKRFGMVGSKRTALFIGVPIMVVGLGYCFAGIFDVVGQSSRTSLPSLVAGCSAGFVLLRSGIRSAPLVTIGVFSYTIYLFHTFATSASRIGLDRVGLDVLPLQLILGVTLGLAVPILIDKIARRRGWSRRAFLGRTRVDP